MLVVAVPHFDAERQAHGDVVEIRIGQFAEQFIHPEVEVRGRTPQVLAFGAELFEQTERMELAIVFGGVLNSLRTKREHSSLASQVASARRAENLGGHAENGNKLPVTGNIIPRTLR